MEPSPGALKITTGDTQTQAGVSIIILEKGALQKGAGEMAQWEVSVQQTQGPEFASLAPT